MRIRYISESAFLEVESARQIIFHEYSRKFAVVELGSDLGLFALGWRSNLIEPILKQFTGTSILWLGVDQQIVVICLSTGRILLKLLLLTNLLEMIKLDSKIIVIAETEVFVFNEDLTFASNHWLPDTVAEIQSFDANLVIHLLDGQRLTLNVQKGSLQ